MLRDQISNSFFQIKSSEKKIPQGRCWKHTWKQFLKMYENIRNTDYVYKQKPRNFMAGIGSMFIPNAGRVPFLLKYPDFAKSSAHSQTKKISTFLLQTSNPNWAAVLRVFQNLLSLLEIKQIITKPRLWKKLKYRMELKNTPVVLKATQHYGLLTIWHTWWK